ncbi:MAG: nuclear transport factor 2 family protein, partial [Pseudomonadota bacterium]
QQVAAQVSLAVVCRLDYLLVEIQSVWADDLKSIAEALCDHCRNGTEGEALQTLYAPDAVSVESVPMPGTDARETHGVEGIQGKHAWWAEAMEVHEAKVDGPYLHGEDRFAVIFETDVTEKASANRMQMKEVGIYTVDGGKISREEFFYTM